MCVCCYACHYSTHSVILCFLTPTLAPTPVKDKLHHVVIPLLGRFKNEDGERWHLMVSVPITTSGIQARKWIERLASVLAKERKGLGPAFCNAKGEMIRYAWFDKKIVEEVKQVQLSHTNLIDAGTDVADNFSICRSIRKGSTARVIDMKVDPITIDLHNRWRTIENRGGSKATKSMQGYYSNLRLVINSRLAYSCALQ